MALKSRSLSHAQVQRSTSAPRRSSARITRTVGVCGGDPCIAGTRIPVWVLYRARQLGATDRKILRMYPRLKTADLKSAWAYVQAHPDEIERMIRENEDW